MEGHSYYRKRESLDPPREKLGFSKEQALKYVKEMTFPRQTGTEGEQRAAQTIVRFLKESGYEVREEDFSFRFPPWLWMKSPSLFFLFSLFIAWLTFEKAPLVAFLFSSAFFFGIGGWEKAWIHFGEWVVSEDLTRGRRSKNILAKIPGGQGENAFYLVAHYDSKSQSLNLYLRTGLFLLGCVAGGVFSLWIWILVIRIWMGGDRFSIPAVIQGCFFLAAGLNVLFLFSKMGNESDGALDNASGVGVLLEVARTLMLRSPKNGVPVFLFTGAEELGLLGSLMFRKRYGKEMVRRKSFLINIDGVGQKGKMRIGASKEVRRRWVSRIRKIADENGIFLRTLPFHKGILMDHLPFCHLSIPSLSLTSISKEGWQVHTVKDQFPLVQKEGLGEMGELILGLIESLEIGNWENAMIKK
jgi:hypothetical protein